MVDPLDVEQMAVRLRELVEDTALRATLRERGLKRARLFSWEKTAEVVRQVLEATVRKR
jgi:glycosyltransferase involved in cell wall biosynthesis